MDQKIAAAEKEVLVEIVRLAQKRGMKGTKGSWKEFLDSYDRKFGSSLSDPARRSVDVLTAFLKTFIEEEDLKFFAKVMRCHSNRKTVEQLTKTSLDVESPKQKLVRLTREHPRYPLDFSFPSYNEDWMVTKISKRSKSMMSNSMIAIDCEMALCEDGTEAVVRVCMVDHNLEVKLDELVKPNKAVADYRTAITGVSAKDLEGITCSLTDIQKSMKKLSHGTILVGHSLNNDLQALKFDHGRVIDTCFIFKYDNEPTFRRPSLNNLCKTVLGYEIRRKGDPHNCLEDACAAMKLVLAKLEHGFDDPIAFSLDEVPETEMAKLLLHGIPIDVPREALQKIFPEDFTIELQPNVKVRGKKYSVIAIFKDPHQACKAFESILGKEEKDSVGRPQKLVSLKLSTGTASLNVRKMHFDDPLEKPASNKRPMQDKEISNESKKPKAHEEAIEGQETQKDSNQCDHRIKEIERLKKELSQRDHEIDNLHKIITALTRKQGL